MTQYERNQDINRKFTELELEVKKLHAYIKHIDKCLAESEQRIQHLENHPNRG